MPERVFNHLECPPVPDAKIVYNGGRKYSSGGRYFESVTNVLSVYGREGIEAWKRRLIEEHGEEKGRAEAERIGSESMKVGSHLHKYIEDYIKNKPVSKSGEDGCVVSPHELFTNARPYLDRIDNIVAQEIRLVSEKWNTAGTPDCIGEYLKKMSIIDFKNSRRPKDKEYVIGYFLQATWYSLMWEELTGQAIPQIVIIACNWDGTTDVFVEDRERWIDLLVKTIAKWQAEQKSRP